MPGIDAPSNGADQGYQKYYPNKTDENDRNGDDGGVSGCTVYTGYTGGNLTATGFNAVPTEGDSVVDLAGQYSNSTYLSVPSNLGYFNANTETEKLNLDMTGKEIVWYVIKNQEDGYHVDGYVKNVPIKVRYHENFNGDTAVKDTVTGIVSGGTVIVKTAGAVFGEDYTHEGYTFAGWSTSQGEDGTVYQSGDQTEELVTSLDLYAKWEVQKHTVTFESQGGSDVASQKVNHGATATTPTEPTKTGFEFKGWYTSAACETVYEFTTAVTEDITLYAKWEKNNYNYTVKFYKDDVNEANHISGADQTKEAAFGTALSALNVDTTIANDKCPDGYKAEGTINTANSLVKIDLTNNVVKVVLSKRNDLSYTVNYLEKGTSDVLHAPSLVQNKTFGEEVTAEAIPIEGYTYDSTSVNALTINVSNNVINLYYTKNPETKTYDIVIHYVDDANTPIKGDVTISQVKNSNYDVTGKIPHNLKDKNGVNYVKETVTGGNVTDILTAKVEITVVYTKDVLVDPTAPKTDEPSDPGDGIPDKYQVTIKYVADSTGRGTVGTLTEEVKTIYKEGKWATSGTVTATGSTATANGSRDYFSSWTNDAKVDTSKAGAALGQQTIANAEGGKTYTFTANFGYSGGGGSGGSSRPSTPPTVDIPDDVPTGLNGKDHYAYIIGYGNNDVRPQNNITRAEVATIFFRLLTDETREANMTKSNGYNDVKDSDWFCCAVSTLSKMGIIKGYEDGSFKPNDPISRAEFAAIAARFDPDGDKTPATFADVTSDWAKDEISIAANHGWIKGYEDGSFKPDQKITRAETMTLVNRVLKRLPETKDDLHKDMKTWVDNMDETAWYYLAVQEATNSHYFKNKTSTKFEQWTDLRDTRDWSELEK